MGKRKILQALQEAVVIGASDQLLAVLKGGGGGRGICHQGAATVCRRIAGACRKGLSLLAKGSDCM